MKNNKFEIKFWFSFEEVLKSIINPSRFISEQQFKHILEEIELYKVEGQEITNPLGLEFVSDFTLSLKVFNRLIDRYGEHYLCSNIKDELTADIRNRALARVMRVLDLTFPKYSKILALYEEKKNSLLAKVESGETESGSSSQGETHSSQNHGTQESKFNDTPQADPTGEDPFAGDQYVSELTKGKNDGSESGSSSVNGQSLRTISRTEDGATPMARLEEVQRLYSQVMKKWLNEFDDLFIEEGNLL